MSAINGITMTRHFENDDCWLVIEEAAPRVTFAASLLRRIRTGWSPEFTLDQVPCIGAILRIRARNRTVIYQLTEYDQQHGTYTGVWPD